jgi:TonB family protein
MSAPYQYKSQIVELRDSTGKLLAEKGTGHVLIYDDNFKQLLEEGDIKNYKRDGEWRGAIADSGKFICTFHKDELKSGVSYMKSGHHYEFNKVYQEPVFSDGQGAFIYFIKKNLQYPESARKYKVTGSVTVEFYVEPNGTVSNARVLQSLLKSLDEEAVRVVSLSPLWYPATVFGIPMREKQTVYVNFYDAYYTHSH